MEDAIQGTSTYLKIRYFMLGINSALCLTLLPMPTRDHHPKRNGYLALFLEYDLLTAELCQQTLP